MTICHPQQTQKIFQRMEINDNLRSILEHSVDVALQEDIGTGDVTAALIPINNTAIARVICRENAVIAGTAWFDRVFHKIDPAIKINWQVGDGDEVVADSCLCELSGNARNILSGERSALNFLQTLSATATITRRYVQAIAHTPCKILDTRKTIPGLREAQKYAVVCGGGNNHRHGLYDGILIKENHIMAAGSISKAVTAAKSLNSNLAIEVEVENLQELDEAIRSGADIVLLDNMDNNTLSQAVSLNQQRVKLEASGGVNIDTIAAIAETGVDYISIGNLTKNINAIDLSMRFQQQG